LSNELVSAGGGLSALFDRTVEELLDVKGLGKAKVATLLAVMEEVMKREKAMLMSLLSRME